VFCLRTEQHYGKGDFCTQHQQQRLLHTTPLAASNIKTLNWFEAKPGKVKRVGAKQCYALQCHKPFVALRCTAMLGSALFYGRMRHDNTGLFPAVG
jgi:hypothetical protein